jgi:hypothetical protein
MALSRAPVASAFDLRSCRRHSCGTNCLQVPLYSGRAVMSDPRVARFGYAMGFRATLVAIIFAPMSAFFRIVLQNLSGFCGRVGLLCFGQVSAL